jgi:hypothetical protein
MFVQVSMFPSELPEDRRALSVGRLAQAYGSLPPAALMLLAVIAVELSWAFLPSSSPIWVRPGRRG